MLDSLKDENRSVSPHCPKPNESEEPLGTSMETGAANGQSPHNVSPSQELLPSIPLKGRNVDAAKERSASPVC